MDPLQMLAEIDAYIPDEMICRDAAEIMELVSRDPDVIKEGAVFSAGVQTTIDEKMLVQNAEVKDGGYFLVRCSLFSFSVGDTDPQPLGSLKIMYDLNGIHLDDFFTLPDD